MGAREAARVDRGRPTRGATHSPSGITIPLGQFREGARPSARTPIRITAYALSPSARPRPDRFR